MANPRRILRLQQLVLEILGQTLRREVEDPAVAMVTFTRVKLTSDMLNATVYWSSLATEKGRERTAEAMERITSFLQGQVASQLQTRVTPRLRFEFDPTLEDAQRLESIFHQLREERGDDEPVEGEESVEGEEPADADGPESNAPPTP